MPGSRAFAALAAAGAAITLTLTGCVADVVDPAPSAAPEVAPTVTAAPESPEITSVPSSCEQLVPEDLRADLDHLDLNTPASQNAGLPSNLGNDDLAALAEGDRVLTCNWDGESSADTYLHTSVVVIDGGDGAAAVKLLTDDRVQCYPADGGTRCEFTSTRSDPAVEYGETHLFREDLWLATAWSNVAPPGYTSALAENLWP